MYVETSIKIIDICPLKYFENENFILQIHFKEKDYCERSINYPFLQKQVISTFLIPNSNVRIVS